MASTERVWLASDTALWQTCHIVSELVAGRFPDYRIDTLFPVVDGEVVLTAGTVGVESYRADGDGSYSYSSGWVFGTGAVGLGLLAGSAIVNSANASRARAEAEAAAQLTWRFEVGGTIFVTNFGFFLQTPSGLLEWGWNSIDLMQVESYNRTIMQGRSEGGPVVWRLTSEWAELVFVLWAMHRHPRHPQLRDGSWLPPGWIDWARAQGYPPHLGRPELEM